MHCTPVQKSDPKSPDCLLLNKHSDFLRVQPITWESAAVYLYKVYVAPNQFLSPINFAKDFVALDVYVLGEQDLRQIVDQAILEAIAEIGARSYRP